MNCFVLTQDMVKCKAVVDKVINNVSLSEGIERRDRMCSTLVLYTGDLGLKSWRIQKISGLRILMISSSTSRQIPKVVTAARTLQFSSTRVLQLITSAILPFDVRRPCH